MGIQVVSGIGATRGAETSPDFTFIWAASETSSETSQSLVVNCNFGGQTNVNNSASATIPWGSSTPVTMTNQQNNSAIAVVGSVQVLWSSTQTSYVVLFYGAMVLRGVNNAFSTNANGVSSESRPIIVAATIAS